MPLEKSILLNTAVQTVLSWIAAQYVRLVHLTGRWEIIGVEYPNRFYLEGKPFIIAFWHGRLLMTAHAWKHVDKVHVLISGHRDGQLLSRMLQRFGAQIVFGSTKKGGVAAFVGLVRLLRRGSIVCITPDGPRGPRMRASDGVVSLAKVGRVPILPMSFSASRRRLLSSWDRFLFPLPFGRGVILWGPPIAAPEDTNDATIEAKRAEVERVLTELTNRADEIMGWPFTEPAPIGASAR